MSFQWEGIFPALITPFSAGDELDLKMFEHLLKGQTEAGIDGIILGGSLGEASVLTGAEKEKLVKFALEKLEGKLPVVLNIAEGSTREAIQQAEKAGQWGADGLMLLPPMRYKADHRETVTYFREIASATNLPIMLYNNPVDYKIEITPDMFEELTICNNIQAVKESTRDVSNVTRMVNRFGSRFKILCGVDTIAMEELLMGAVGWVAGLVNAFPRETVAIYRLVKAGRIREATEIYRWFLPLLELDLHPKLVQYIKLAAAKTGLGSEWMRAPRLRISGEERESIEKLIMDGIASRPVLPDYLKL
jgi:4-hydroxy-tetrahydrodipicolinate synthase